MRGYGQRDPLVEYKTESFKMFMELMEFISNDVLDMVFKLYPERSEQLPSQRMRRPIQMVLSHDSADGAGFAPNKEAVSSSDNPRRAQQQPQGQRVQQIRAEPKVGRNDPCPCGSGKKYKNCHGVS